MSTINLVIEIDKDYYEMLKYNVENGQKYKPWEIIANGKPYKKTEENKYDDLPKRFNPPEFPKDGFIHTYAERSEEKKKPIDIDEYFNNKESEAKNERQD